MTLLGDKIEYYYESNLRQICAVRWSNEDVENSKTRIFIGTSFSGAAVTFIKSFFNGISLRLNVTLMACIILVIFLITFYALQKYDNYLQKRGKIIEVDIAELVDYFNRGKGRRRKQLICLLMFFILSWCILSTLTETHDPFWLVLYLGDIVVIMLILGLVAPIQIIKFKLYIRRCKKECQNK